MLGKWLNTGAAVWSCEAVQERQIIVTHHRLPMKKKQGKNPFRGRKALFFAIYLLDWIGCFFLGKLTGKITPLKTNEYSPEHFLEKMVPFQGTFVHFQGIHSKFQSGRDLEKFAAAWRNKERSTIAGCLLCCVD